MYGVFHYLVGIATHQPPMVIGIPQYFSFAKLFHG